MVAFQGSSTKFRADDKITDKIFYISVFFDKKQPKISNNNIYFISTI